MKGIVLFEIEEIFDLRGRSQLIIAGVLRQGNIAIEDDLRVQGTDRSIPVLSIELVRLEQAPCRFNLLVPKGLEPPLRVGDVLESVP